MIIIDELYKEHTYILLTKNKKDTRFYQFVYIIVIRSQTYITYIFYFVPTKELTINNKKLTYLRKLDIITS